MGKSKRIIIGDTLLEKFTADEIETVFAHEIGHYVHGHIWQNLLFGTAINFISPWLANVIYQFFIHKYGFQGPADIAALPLLSLILGVIAFITQPLGNMLSRHHERQADRYAINHSQQPGVFSGALYKLSEVNLTDREPHPLVEFMFHSHPSVSKRVKFCDRLLSERNPAAVKAML